jgi:hypothetical protein
VRGARHPSAESAAAINALASFHASDRPRCRPNPPPPLFCHARPVGVAEDPSSQANHATPWFPTECVAIAAVYFAEPSQVLQK